MVIASHSNDLLRSTCNKAALMSAGRIVSFGPVADVLEDYDAMIHGRAMLHATA
jgi:ABC-type polysaccharide/polyol phosphate transport system ATPase subunit